MDTKNGMKHIWESRRLMRFQIHPVAWLALGLNSYVPIALDLKRLS